MTTLAQAHARQLSRMTKREREISRGILRHARPARLKDTGRLVMLYNGLRVYGERG